jgi:uncharacterized protein with HEPN domain
VPPTLADRITHILRSIDAIQQLLAGRTLETFNDDFFMRLAVERSFEIISEASRRIPNEVKTSRADIDWDGIAALGNQLRHAYHRIDAKILWTIAEQDLPPLRLFAEKVLRDEQRR